MEKSGICKRDNTGSLIRFKNKKKKNKIQYIFMVPLMEGL